MKRFIAACLAAALLVAAPARGQLGTLPEVALSLGMRQIHAELADSVAARMQGLMYRTSLAPNSGMLFVYERPAMECMWMKNTLIPLSVAFIDDAGAIINIAAMQPQTEESHCATRPASYALEMEQGWFARNGIRPGAVLLGLEQLRQRPR
ncbi:MAG TPA: DUF192 domain-containing protein [Burkholderiales bacterium]|nr:DUF192 domain-containing protein [Burkholderiales bacterium]